MTKPATNKLFIFNVLIIIIATIADIFWTELGLTEAENIYFGFVGILIFGISIGGIFIGINEKKSKGNKTLIGLFGNSILTVTFLIIFFYISLIMER